MAEVKKKTDTEYIVENLKFYKNTIGLWEVSFICADGYCYSISESGTGRAVKDRLKSRIVDRVLTQFEHPIQRVAEKRRK